jgi:hypothetical protein
MLFKWFPDAEIAWGDVLPGAGVTAILFNVGKMLIGWYIGTQGLGAPISPADLAPHGPDALCFWKLWQPGQQCLDL